jgi:hypothetical protein
MSDSDALQGMVNAAPDKQAALTDQIAQIQEKQNTLLEQITACTNSEDYIAAKVIGILNGYANSLNISGTFLGEWTVGETYSVGNSVVVTNRTTPYACIYYTCLTGGLATTENGPGTASWTVTALGGAGAYAVIIGAFNVKAYGSTLRAWNITFTPDPTPPVFPETEPTPGVPVIVYQYQAGSLWGTVPTIDNQLLELIADWESTNDLVTKPLTEVNATARASYGLESNYASLETAKTYLTNNRDKTIAMPSVLSKYI